MDEEHANETVAGGREKEPETLQQQEVSSSTTTTTMKFSFSASKPKFSASRPPQFPKVGGKRRSDEAGGGRVGEDDNVEFVTGFDEQGLVGKDSKGLRGARVIPKMENSFRPEKRMKNIVMETDIMTTSQDERFEEEETVVGGLTPGVQYGLTAGFKKVVETSSTVTTKLNGNDVVQETTVATGVERTTEQKTTPLTYAQLEDERLRRDLTNLPDEADLDAYEEMPVEDFGEALLRGMGWEKGQPIGLNSKVAVVPVEYVRRSGRTGLGAEPVPKDVNNGRQIKPGESRQPAPDLVASVGPDGRVRNVVTVDEKLVERSSKGVVKGKVMSIISGRHLGLRGEVLDSDKSDRIVMKLVKSGEKVLVSAADLADVGSLEEEKVLKQIRQLKIGNGEASQSDDRKDDSNPTEDRKEENRYGRKEDKRESRRDTRQDERDDYRLRTEYRREEEERSSRSRRDNRRDEKDGRRDRKREDYKRTGDDMDVEDEGRSRRSEDRRSSAKDQKKEERRDEERRGESKRDGRREDLIRTHQDRDERGAERERRSSHSDKESEKQRVDSNGGSSLRDAIGASTEGRYRDSWLTSQIRVRIISKTLKGGRFYLKKGRIVDVVTPKECDILLDESGEILQQVKQDQLETALPKRGGRIMVVGGKYRGHLGKLIERDPEGEVGLVQMEESFEMRTLDLDLLAEFVGEASERDD
ncbi:unnamed protein product [Calypogeia fissa]